MIHLLDEGTIQKIAAGEVIERPVSVVKELVENSVDAGANDISIEIKDGGKSEILVTDNGVGIAEDEIEKAFLPHATSKIETFNDLYSLRSFGFRGEALASIAAVSKVTCRSQTKDQETGLEVYMENGKVLSSTPIAMKEGTQILVEDLFYSMPVRKKMLKSSSSEGGKISQLLYSLAIGNPLVSFRFVKEGRRIFQTSSQNTLNENLLILFGSSYYKSLLAFSDKSPHFKIEGRIGDNTFYRGNRNMEFLYVNNRFVYDQEIRDSIEKVYQSVIPNGRFPAWQIFIETEPSEIEVNIHPSKKTVFFRHKEELLGLLEERIRKTLFQELSIPSSEEKEPKGLFSDMTSQESYQAILDQYSWPEELRKKEDYSKEKSEGYNLSSNDADPSSLIETKTDEDEGEEFIIQAKELDEEPFSQSSFLESKGPDSNEIKPSLSENSKDQSPLPAYENLRFIGILFKTYIILEDPSEERILLIDQHAAHERINFERFMKQLKTEKVVSQKLLKPLNIKLTDLQMEALEKKKVLLRKLGYAFDVFGEDSLVLREVPAIFQGEREEAVFLDLLDLSFEGLDSLDAMIDKMAMKACRASIKQGDTLSQAEVENLYRELSKTNYPLSCPHGRPTVIIRDKRDFEKAFMRIK